MYTVDENGKRIRIQHSEQRLNDIIDQALEKAYILHYEELDEKFGEDRERRDDLRKGWGA